jgi:hypothetical protein
MKNSQKGSSIIWLFIFVLLLGGIGYYYFYIIPQQESKKEPVVAFSDTAAGFKMNVPPAWLKENLGPGKIGGQYKDGTEIFVYRTERWIRALEDYVQIKKDEHPDFVSEEYISIGSTRFYKFEYRTPIEGRLHRAIDLVARHNNTLFNFTYTIPSEYFTDREATAIDILNSIRFID